MQDFFRECQNDLVNLTSCKYSSHLVLVQEHTKRQKRRHRDPVDEEIEKGVLFLNTMIPSHGQPAPSGKSSHYKTGCYPVRWLYQWTICNSASNELIMELFVARTYTRACLARSSGWNDVLYQSNLPGIPCMRSCILWCCRPFLLISMILHQSIGFNSIHWRFAKSGIYHYGFHLTELTQQIHF